MPKETMITDKTTIGNLKRRFKRFAITCFVVLLAGLVGFCTGFFVARKEPVLKEAEAAETVPTEFDAVIEEEEFTLSIAYVEELLRPASDLVTTKFYYTDADVYENYKEAFGKKIPFTTDEVVFTYSGIIHLGIDLSKVIYTVDNRTRIIGVTLPPLEILSNEIDANSFEYPHIVDSIFNSTNMSDYTALIGQLKAQKEAEVAANAELMEEALNNTKQVFRQFLNTSEFTKEYMVVFS